MNFLQTKSGLFLLALLSGIVLSLSWPSAGVAPLLFIAFIPLLFIEDVVYRQPEKYSRWLLFGCVYFAFLTFNLLTTWWVKYASFFGAVAAIVFNALFMAIVFHLFHITKRKLGKTLGYGSLILYWVTFEYWHMDWDLSWPWLTIGNGFAGWIKMIQWYEFTGVLGGTVWVLVTNILLYISIKWFLFSYKRDQALKRFYLALIIISVPLLYSLIRYYTFKEEHNPVNIAVIQPNIDPYNEKFSGMSSDDQLARILQLASAVTDSTTNYVVAPETALPNGMWEEQLSEDPHINLLKNFQSAFPHLHWVIGAATHSFYPDSGNRSSTARKFTQSEGYYDSYNTALQIEKKGRILIHHKSKLVPGVEKMPFPAIFKHLDNFAIDLGGISGSLGMQEIPSVFGNVSDPKIIAPVICYESIYGDYLSQYIRLGAQLIFIITNDGWWSDTPGYRQHLKYATLRAIEFRRSIARSANTGISCFIDQRGTISQATKWWEPDAIKSTLNANSNLTFYARHGDYIGVMATFGSLVMLIVFFVKRKK